MSQHSNALTRIPDSQSVSSGIRNVPRQATRTFSRDQSNNQPTASYATETNNRRTNNLNDGIEDSVVDEATINRYVSCNINSEHFNRGVLKSLRQIKFKSMWGCTIFLTQTQQSASLVKRAHMPTNDRRNCFNTVKSNNIVNNTISIKWLKFLMIEHYNYHIRYSRVGWLLCFVVWFYFHTLYFHLLYAFLAIGKCR